MIKNLMLFVICAVGGLTGAVAGQAVSTADVCDVRAKVAANTGYVAGCTMAFHAINHDRDSDPLDPIYIDWCVHNAVVFSQRVESGK